MTLLIPTHEELSHFVRESNAIERIYEAPGHPLYDKHLAAAEMIVAEAPHGYFSVREVHSMLLRGIEVFHGQYRTEPAEIADGEGGVVTTLPNPFWVEQVLMPEYEKLVYQCRLKAIPALMSEIDRTALAWALHDHGVCIHPFKDGNGRTFRLFMNQLRLAFGLPWYTVEKKMSNEYYAHIGEYETHFKEGREHMYP